VRETAEIERLAEAELDGVPGYVWDGFSLPVPVEHIADSHFGLWIRDEDDLGRAPGAPDVGPGQSLSGLLLPDRAEIWVNASEARDWPPRRRFTIGHELGHWCLHREAGSGVFCRAATVEVEPDPPPISASRPQRSPAESEANAFGAALLMPARLLRHHYADTGRDFGRLCEIFGASGAAMGRRLHAVV